MIFRRSSSRLSPNHRSSTPTPRSCRSGRREVVPVRAAPDFRPPPNRAGHQAGRVRLDHGPVGAGKSTLLHIMGMHDRAWSGEYQLLGQPIHQLAAEGSRRSSRSAHRLRLPELSPARQPDGLREHRAAALLPRRQPSERQSIVADVLDRFGIVAKKDLYPNQLSGGQQQLVGVARAIVANPASSSPTSRPATCTRRRPRRSWSCSSG